MDIANQNKISFKIFKNIKKVGARRILAFERLWALEWTWHPAETKCAAQESLESA